MPDALAHESSRPPPPPSAKPRDNGWRPADDDDSPRAVAWRSRHGLDIAREARGEVAQLKGSIDSLATNVGALTGAVNSVKGLTAWALRIIGAAAVLGGAKLAWDWLAGLHH